MIRHLLIPIGGLMLALVVLGGWHLEAPTTEVVLHAESKLWIEGSSTVNRFTCDARAINGQARLEQDAPTAGQGKATMRLVVPVRQFDCGQRRMNRDFHEAMDASEHPFVHYELDSANILEENGDSYLLQATGRLNIAGAEREVTITVEAHRLPDGRFRAQGSQPLSMTDFGIEPPTAMMGLIKAHDEIEVHFDLIARPPA